MRKIMVFQHVGHEPLGTLDPMLKAAGFRIRYVNFGRHPDSRPSLKGYGGLIVLGGPMGVYESAHHPHLTFEMKMIEEAFKLGIPVLGICLGSQLMAAVLGSPVGKAPRWEIGWTPVHMEAAAAKDPLFAGYGPTEKIFQLHQDTFSVPADCVHLARSEICSGQAFKYGDKAYGLQFHLEVDHLMVARWLKRPENIKVLETIEGGLTAETIELETQKLIQRSLELSQSTFGAFIDLLGVPDRTILLGSGHGKGRHGRD